MFSRQVRREGNRRKRKRRPERASEAVDPGSNGLHALHAAALQPSGGMTTRRSSRSHPVREETPKDDEEAQPTLSCALCLCDSCMGGACQWTCMQAQAAPQELQVVASAAARSPNIYGGQVHAPACFCAAMVLTGSPTLHFAYN